MKKEVVIKSASLLAMILSGAVYANEQIIIAPKCLTSQLTVPYQTLATQQSFNLIAIDESGITELAMAKAKRDKLCGGFTDVSFEWHQNKSTAANFLNKNLVAEVGSKQKKEYKIQYPQQVEAMISKVNPDRLWADLTGFTTYKDRYANSDTGVAAANWLKQTVETIASDNHRTDVTAYFVNTGVKYKQPSLVVKVGEGTGPGIVVGGHMDTLKSSTGGNKPGADDDGTGAMTVLETARVVLSNNMHFKKPIYFIWYAAEEEGLVGSSYVVREFKEKNIPVDAVLHLDMTGYAYQNSPDMWVLDDHVNKDLTAYLEKLINTYVKQTVHHTRCGYGCSDHASWTAKGFASAMPVEGKFENTNPHIHTPQDTMEKLSLSHMTDFAKLAAAFVVELGEPA